MKSDKCQYKMYDSALTDFWQSLKKSILKLLSRTIYGTAVPLKTVRDGKSITPWPHLYITQWRHTSIPLTHMITMHFSCSLFQWHTYRPRNYISITSGFCYWHSRTHFVMNLFIMNLICEQGYVYTKFIDQLIRSLLLKVHNEIRRELKFICYACRHISCLVYRMQNWLWMNIAVGPGDIAMYFIVRNMFGCWRYIPRMYRVDDSLPGTPYILL